MAPVPNFRQHIPQSTILNSFFRSRACAVFLVLPVLGLLTDTRLKDAAAENRENVVFFCNDLFNLWLALIFLC